MQLPLRRLAFLTPLAGAFLLSGCSLINSEFEATVTANFELRGMTETDDDVIPINPDDEPDVRDNRDLIRERSGVLRSITVTVNSMLACNTASEGGGTMQVKRHSQSDNEYRSIGTYANVPLFPTQVINIQMTPETRQYVQTLIFDEPHEAIDLKYTAAADGIPCFSGTVKVIVDFRGGPA